MAEREDNATPDTQPAHSPPTLTRFLAANDSRCDICGYNLRGVEQPFCPECGRVIPRPHVDDVELFEGRAQRRTRCVRCKYPLQSVTGDVCPECGESVYLFTKAKVRRRAGPLIGSLPGSLNAIVVIALILLLLCIVKIVEAALRHSSSSMSAAIGATLLAAAPLAAAVAWTAQKTKIAALPDSSYSRLLMLSFWGSLGALLCAAWLL
jgi:hypothetical protein